MGTFNLDWSVGADAYGHVGDTYGYQSQTTYIPGLLGCILIVLTEEIVYLYPSCYWNVAVELL